MRRPFEGIISDNSEKIIFTSLTPLILQSSIRISFTDRDQRFGVKSIQLVLSTFRDNLFILTYAYTCVFSTLIYQSKTNPCGTSHRILTTRHAVVILHTDIDCLGSWRTNLDLYQVHHTHKAYLIRYSDQRYRKLWKKIQLYSLHFPKHFVNVLIKLPM